MNEEEFRKMVEEFWVWVSKTERPAVSWFLSLEEWAKDRFYEEYRLMKKKEES